MEPDPADSDNAALPTHWKTSEGDVYVETHGDLLVVFESLDATNVAKLRTAIAPDK